MINFILNIIHWFAHKFRMNEGKVVTWREKNEVYVGFECTHCKKISDVERCVLPRWVFEDETTKYKETTE